MLPQKGGGEQSQYWTSAQPFSARTQRLLSGSQTHLHTPSHGAGVVVVQIGQGAVSPRTHGRTTRLPSAWSQSKAEGSQWQSLGLQPESTISHFPLAPLKRYVHVPWHGSGGGGSPVVVVVVVVVVHGWTDSGPQGVTVSPSPGQVCGPTQ